MSLKIKVISYEPGDNDSEFRFGESHLYTYFERECDGQRRVIALANSLLGQGVTVAYEFANGSSLAIASGASYFFSPGLDQNPVIVVTEPVKEAVPLADRSGAILAAHTKILRIHGEGVAWISQQISYDGIKNLKVVSDRVLGLGYNAPTSNEEFPIILELDSGRIIESAYP